MSYWEEFLMFFFLFVLLFSELGLLLKCSTNEERRDKTKCKVCSMVDVARLLHCVHENEITRMTMIRYGDMDRNMKCVRPIVLYAHAYFRGQHIWWSWTRRTSTQTIVHYLCHHLQNSHGLSKHVDLTSFQIFREVLFYTRKNPVLTELITDCLLWYRTGLCLYFRVIRGIVQS